MNNSTWGGHNKFDWGGVIWAVEGINLIRRGWQSRKKCKISSRLTDPTFKLQVPNQAKFAPFIICPNLSLFDSSPDKHILVSV